MTLRFATLSFAAITAGCSSAPTKPLGEQTFPAAHGTREMPVWGPVFSATQQLVTDAESSEQRIAGLMAYLRELQR